MHRTLFNRCKSGNKFNCLHERNVHQNTAKCKCMEIVTPNGVMYNCRLSLDEEPFTAACRNLVFLCKLLAVQLSQCSTGKYNNMRFINERRNSAILQ
jgi:hypothetical protein